MTELIDNDERKVLRNEFFQALDDWRSLGFLETQDLQRYVPQMTPEEKDTDYGYINIIENSVIFGLPRINLSEDLLSETKLFLVISRDCETQQYSEYEISDGRVLRIHPMFSLNFAFFHKDIEFLKAIKSKYLQTLHETQQYLNDTNQGDDGLKFVHTFLTEMILYLKKQQRRAKHD